VKIVLELRVNTHGGFGPVQKPGGEIGMAVDFKKFLRGSDGERPQRPQRPVSQSLIGPVSDEMRRPPSEEKRTEWTAPFEPVSTSSGS